MVAIDVSTDAIADALATTVIGSTRWQHRWPRNDWTDANDDGTTVWHARHDAIRWIALGQPWQYVWRTTRFLTAPAIQCREEGVKKPTHEVLIETVALLIIICKYTT